MDASTRRTFDRFPGESMSDRQPTATKADLEQDEHSAPETWLDKHGAALYRHALVRVRRREVAEDLLQDTLLAAIKGRTEFRGDCTIRTWLHAIMNRKILDYLRKIANDRVQRPSDAPLPEGDALFDKKGKWKDVPAKWPRPDQVLERRDFRRVFDACVSKLPKSLGVAFILRDVMGAEFGRLQQELCVSAGSARTRLYRARQSLRQCLQKNWFDSN